MANLDEDEPIEDGAESKIELITRPQKHPAGLFINPSLHTLKVYLLADHRQFVIVPIDGVNKWICLGKLTAAGTAEVAALVGHYNVMASLHSNLIDLTDYDKMLLGRYDYIVAGYRNAVVFTVMPVGSQRTNSVVKYDIARCPVYFLYGNQRMACYRDVDEKEYGTPVERKTLTCVGKIASVFTPGSNDWWMKMETFGELDLLFLKTLGIRASYQDKAIYHKFFLDNTPHHA